MTKHYAVYEGDGSVSDTVVLGDMCLLTFVLDDWMKYEQNLMELL